MAPFDPYHIWLEISPDEQPPTPHRLLGIAPDETDKEIIREAALQRNAFIRQFSLGEQGKIAERLLNEIAAARDNILAGNVQTAVETPSPVETPIEPDVEKVDPAAATPVSPIPVVVREPVIQEFPVSVVQPTKKPRREVPKEIWKRPAVIGVSVVGVIGVFVLVISLMFSGDADPVASNLPPSLQQGLFAYYPFNGNTKDESGNGHHGVAEGTVSLTTGRTGQADSAYAIEPRGSINVSPEDSLFPYVGSGTVTYALWAKLTSNAMVLSQYLNMNVPACHFGFGVGKDDVSVTGQGTDSFLFNRMNGYDQWNHYVMSIDGQNGKVNLWADGIHVDQGRVTLNPSSTSTQPFRMGFNPSCGVSPGGERRLYLDDIRIYNRALSAVEIQQLYEYEKP